MLCKQQLDARSLQKIGEAEGEGYRIEELSSLRCECGQRVLAQWSNRRKCWTPEEHFVRYVRNPGSPNPLPDSITPSSVDS